MPISAITHLQTIIYNVLLVKIKGPVWYTIYHQTNRLFKGFVQARLLINQPIGKGHLCHMISAMISTKKNKHISNHIYFICGVLSLTIILSESYTYQPDEVCPFSIDIPPYINIYIYTPYIIVYVIQNGFVTCIQQYYNIWGMGTEPYIYISMAISGT
jgi:hypothetical protein